MVMTTPDESNFLREFRRYVRFAAPLATSSLGKRIPLSLEDLGPLPPCSSALPWADMPFSLNDQGKITSIVLRAVDLYTWLFLIYTVRYSAPRLTMEQKQEVLCYLFHAMCITHDHVRQSASDYLDLMKMTPAIPFHDIDLAALEDVRYNYAAIDYTVMEREKLFARY